MRRTRLVFAATLILSFWVVASASAYITQYASQNFGPQGSGSTCSITGQHWRETVGNYGTALTYKNSPGSPSACYEVDVQVQWYHEDLGWLTTTGYGTPAQVERRVTLSGILTMNWSKHRGCILNPAGGSVTCYSWKTLY